MSYGLKVLTSTGAVRLDTTDRTIRGFATFTGDISNGQTKTHTLVGFNPSDATIGLDWSISSNRWFSSLITSTNQIQITRSNDPSTVTAQYQIKVYRV